MHVFKGAEEIFSKYHMRNMKPRQWCVLKLFW